MLRAYPAVGCRNEEKGLLAFPVAFPEAICFPTLWRSAEAEAWQRDNGLKTAWNDKQCFCKDRHLGRTRMCSLKHSGLCQMWGEVLLTLSGSYGT